MPQGYLAGAMEVGRRSFGGGCRQLRGASGEVQSCLRGSLGHRPTTPRGGGWVPRSCLRGAVEVPGGTPRGTPSCLASPVTPRSRCKWKTFPIEKGVFTSELWEPEALEKPLAPALARTKRTLKNGNWRMKLQNKAASPSPSPHGVGGVGSGSSSGSPLTPGKRCFRSS